MRRQLSFTVSGLLCRDRQLKTLRNHEKYSTNVGKVALSKVCYWSVHETQFFPRHKDGLDMTDRWSYEVSLQPRLQLHSYVHVGDVIPRATDLTLVMLFSLLQNQTITFICLISLSFVKYTDLFQREVGIWSQKIKAAVKHRYCKPF